MCRVSWFGYYVAGELLMDGDRDAREAMTIAYRINTLAVTRVECRRRFLGRTRSRIRGAVLKTVIRGLFGIMSRYTNFPVNIHIPYKASQTARDTLAKAPIIAREDENPCTAAPSSECNQHLRSDLWSTEARLKLLRG